MTPAEDVLLRAVDARRELAAARAATTRTTNQIARLEGNIAALCEAVWIMSGRRGGYGAVRTAVLATARERPRALTVHPMADADTAERLRREHQDGDLAALRRHLTELSVTLEPTEEPT